MENVILNRKDSDFVIAASTLGNGETISCLWHWLYASTAIISNTAYAALRTNYLNWRDAYNAGALYFTPEVGDPYLAEGISHFPIPPAR